MECITGEYKDIDLNDSKDQAMKAIIKTIWNKMLQKEGSYDFFDIFQHQEVYGLNKQWNLDILEYFGPLKIDKTKDDRGRGLFATKDIMKGELILVEKAYAHSVNVGLDDLNHTKIAT